VGEAHLPAEFARQVSGLPLMDSVFMVHLGLDYAPPVPGPVTYYYGTYDVEGEILRARQGIYHEGRAGFVVHVPSLHTPGMAPAGCNAMTIYTICPDRLKEGTWQECKEEYTEKLLEHAEKRIPGLRSHIKVCEIITPDEWRTRTHTAHHAFGGIAPINGAWKAPHRTPIQGLWFVGAQSESGGGINAVVPAAYKTAKTIIKESRKA
jgi:phytoene dehydrogenase-like protein